MDRLLSVTMVAVALGAACTEPAVNGGGAGGAGQAPGAAGMAGQASAATDSSLTDPKALGFTGMLRLSKAEYRRAVSDLLGVPAPQALSTLPEDILTPFDNDYGSQVLSPVLIAGLSDVAREAVSTALAGAESRAQLVSCTPTGPGDATCFAAAIERFGRLALRRPLGTEEVSRFVQLQSFSVERADFYAGLSLALRALLQDAEFIYRVEVGAPVSPGLVKLTGYEVATRLAFLLWGAPPDSALLDAASAGELETDMGLRAAAERLLSDARAAERIARFHALWLNYENVDAPAALKASMKAESSALVTRVLFEQGKPWGELFTSAEAFVDQNLAPIYGLEAPAEPTWLGLTDPNRRGILGQAGFLAGGAKFGDTSPVLRGLQVRSRLLCQQIPPPPPTVNADQPPMGDPGACKSARYKAHAANPCASCHVLLDPVGFGLERYGADGRYREVENGRPDCPIEGEGKLNDLGLTFQGPAGLAQALLPTGQLEHCAMQQLTQFAIGRQLSSADDGFVSALASTFDTDEHHLPQLLLDFVSSPAFRHRVTEKQP